MRALLFTAALLISAGAAHAEIASAWLSPAELAASRYQGGPGGWTGTTTQQGNETYSHFNGPPGQSLYCTSTRVGHEVYTSCN